MKRWFSVRSSIGVIKRSHTVCGDIIVQMTQIVYRESSVSFSLTNTHDERVAVMLFV